MCYLNLYAVFHLNLAYSSIEEEQRPEVVRRCYWPLLRLASRYNLPFGIELSSYTLETIAAIDAAWLDELRRLTTKGPCEFIGSGYAQIIGPLVPPEVNAANLSLGHQVYDQLLGFRPRIALVNEQGYSVGLIRHFLEAGYLAIIMEWDNPFRYHQEWNPEWRYFPQVVCGQYGEKLPIIWNNAIAFQKFQRYAHGEMELDEYRDYLHSHLSDHPRCFSLYGNDVEIFNFRPERYHTEAVLREDEWERIGKCFEVLLDDNRFQFIRPGDVLKLINEPEAGNRFHLESSEQPILVKKQEKYNITRWAVTGRDDLGINTECWRIYQKLKSTTETNDDDWKELCYLWSSDFRTHLTERRWKAYREKLSAFNKKVGGNSFRSRLLKISESHNNDSVCKLPDDVHFEQNDSYLAIETNAIAIRLNRRRGLAIEGLWFKDISEQWLCGTLHHGYYDNISWGADYYTGHLVLESPGSRRITDLEPVEPVSIDHEKATDSMMVQGKIRLDCGDLYKSFRIYRRKDQPFVDIDYELDWSKTMIGSLRLGYITINPELFSQPKLFYATHNGGYELEYFQMTDPINHGDAVSFLVSAKQALGCTGSVVRLGDDRYCIDVTADKSASSLCGMIHYQRVGKSYICRLVWSAREMDDTSRTSSESMEPLQCSLRVSANQCKES
jgi:hypothetical protein